MATTRRTNPAGTPPEGLRGVPGTTSDQAYELVAVSELTNHPDNPRKGNIAAIEESIRAHGLYGALVAQRSTGYVLAGNHRLRAARNVGLTRVPVTWVDVDDEAARRILLVDNRTADDATYDDEALRQILAELAETDLGLAGTGYSDAELTALMEGASADAARAARGGTAGTDHSQGDEPVSNDERHRAEFGGDDPAPEGDRYRAQFGVIVVCADEAEQTKIRDDLVAQGYNAKSVTT